MKTIMVAKRAMTDFKNVVGEFKKLKKMVLAFVGSPKTKLVISNYKKAKSPVIYYLNLSFGGVELIVKSPESHNVTYLNFNNGDICSTLYQQPVRCMNYLTHFIKTILADLMLGNAEFIKKQIQGEVK